MDYMRPLVLKKKICEGIDFVFCEALQGLDSSYHGVVYLHVKRKVYFPSTVEVTYFLRKRLRGKHFKKASFPYWINVI